MIERKVSSTVLIEGRGDKVRSTFLTVKGWWPPSHTVFSPQADLTKARLPKTRNQKAAATGHIQSSVFLAIMKGH